MSEIESGSGKIYGALAKAQGEMKNAELDKTNYYKQRYASLAKIRDAVTPALAKNGICITQEINSFEHGIVLVTRLVHEDGSQVRSDMPLPAVKAPHEMGSALTYARRYSLSAICGISGDDDDDGEAAQAGVENAVSETPAQQGAQKQANGRYHLKGDGPATTMPGLRQQLKAVALDVKQIVRDEAYLVGFLKDNDPLIQQGKNNVPEFWGGNPSTDWEGMSVIIDEAFKRVREADQEFPLEDKVMAG